MGICARGLFWGVAADPPDRSSSAGYKLWVELLLFCPERAAVSSGSSGSSSSALSFRYFADFVIVLTKRWRIPVMNILLFRLLTVSPASLIESGTCGINFLAASFWFAHGWRSKTHCLKYNCRGLNCGESMRSCLDTYGSPVTAEALNEFQWTSALREEPRACG